MEWCDASGKVYCNFYGLSRWSLNVNVLEHRNSIKSINKHTYTPVFEFIPGRCAGIAGISWRAHQPLIIISHLPPHDPSAKSPSTPALTSALFHSTLTLLTPRPRSRRATSGPSPPPPLPSQCWKCSTGVPASSLPPLPPPTMTPTTKEAHERPPPSHPGSTPTKPTKRRASSPLPSLSDRTPDITSRSRRAITNPAANGTTCGMPSRHFSAHL